jgi:glycerophosphoryl diester phosphodiesterase
LARYATENTSPAILLAATAGANGVEVDIRFTKDRVPVLFHDSKVIQSGRTLVPLRKLTCEELKTIKMHPANQIPTLDDFLGYGKRFSLIMLDLKDVRKGRASYEDLNGISECLKMHGVIEKVIVHLADPEWVKQASELGMIASLRLPSGLRQRCSSRNSPHHAHHHHRGQAYYERYGWSDLGFAVCAQECRGCLVVL